MAKSGVSSLVGASLRSFMREIKFRAFGRAFDSDQPSMTEPFDFKKYVMYNEGAQSKLLPTVGEDVVYMQYTGLIDKHGAEIYEGDILKDKGGYFWEIRWSNHRCGFLLSQLKRQTPKEPVMNPFNHAGNMEIVGNIYENPELLESK